MKKIFCILLMATILTVGVGSIMSSASFITGLEVMSRDITMIKTGLLGQKMTFCDSDFKSALCIPDFDKLTITSLPSSTTGTLLLAGRRVSEGQTIKRRNVAALVFVPLSRDVTEAEFRFVIDNQAGGSETVCKMKFIDRINHAPTPDETEQTALSLTTQSEISVYGKMSATDPEGDKIEYILVSYPKNGSIKITDKENGRFKYTPTDDFTGYDKLVYVARDCYGNYSEPVSVDIKVIKRMSSQVYRDMTDRSEYNAAVAMSALGIMSGKMLGDDHFFMPEETVSRAEFVAMAMKAYGIRPDSSLTSSFFDDNADIPKSLVGYVATAQRLGIIDGELDGTSLVFKPNENIGGYEAAQVMSRLLGAEDASEDEEFSYNENLPVWARSCVYAMYTLGIFDEGDTDVMTSVTRADAAEYLYRMINAK